jgi:hypothetical protein
MTERLGGVLMQARHEIDIDLARHDERQKLALLQRILSGNMLPSEVSHLGSAYGLQPDSEHWVFRARHPDGTPRSLTRHIERTCVGQHFPALVGPIDGDLAGITCRRPSVNDDVTVLATVGPFPLPMLGQAFAECTRLLNVAVRGPDQPGGPACPGSRTVTAEIPGIRPQNRSGPCCAPFL